MKVKLQLEGDLYEDGPEVIDGYLHGPDWRSVVNSLDQYLRGKIKYEDLPPRKRRIYEEIRKQLWQEINNYDLTL